MVRKPISPLPSPLEIHSENPRELIGYLISHLRHLRSGSDEERRAFLKSLRPEWLPELEIAIDASRPREYDSSGRQPKRDIVFGLCVALGIKVDSAEFAEVERLTENNPLFSSRPFIEGRPLAVASCVKCLLDERGEAMDALEFTTELVSSYERLVPIKKKAVLKLLEGLSIDTLRAALADRQLPRFNPYSGDKLNEADQVILGIALLCDSPSPEFVEQIRERIGLNRPSRAELTETEKTSAMLDLVRLIRRGGVAEIMQAFDVPPERVAAYSTWPDIFIQYLAVGTGLENKKDFFRIAASFAAYAFNCEHHARCLEPLARGFNRDYTPDVLTALKDFHEGMPPGLVLSDPTSVFLFPGRSPLLLEFCTAGSINLGESPCRGVATLYLNQHRRCRVSINSENSPHLAETFNHELAHAETWVVRTGLVSGDINKEILEELASRLEDPSIEESDLFFAKNIMLPYLREAIETCYTLGERAGALNSESREELDLLLEDAESLYRTFFETVFTVKMLYRGGTAKATIQALLRASHDMQEFLTRVSERGSCLSNYGRDTSSRELNN